MALPGLRVNTAVLATAGQQLLGAANAIPPAPTPVVPTGADPLSAAIAAHVTSTVTPLVAARPAVKEEARGFAQAVGTAARTYVGTDEPLGNKIDRQMSGFGAR